MVAVIESPTNRYGFGRYGAGPYGGGTVADIHTVDVLNRDLFLPGDVDTWWFTPPIRYRYKGHSPDRRARNLVAPTSGTGVAPFVLITGLVLYGMEPYGSGPYGGPTDSVTVTSISTPSNRRLTSSDFAFEGGVTYEIGDTLHGILEGAGFTWTGGYGNGGYGVLGYGT